MSVTLYGEPYWYSPYVFSAFVALTEKGVPFDVKTVSLERGEQRGAALAPALTGRVPALEHDGFWLAESSAIVEYVDESFPGPPLLPVDKRERARARQLMAWIRSDLLPLREERPTTTMFFARAEQPMSAACRAAADKLLSVAERAITGPQLFTTFSVADADLAFVLHRLILNDEPLPERVRAFATAVWSRPSVRAFVEHDRPSTPPGPY